MFTRLIWFGLGYVVGTIAGDTALITKVCSTAKNCIMAVYAELKRASCPDAASSKS